MSKSLEGLLAIVTGATRGIGAAIAVRLQKEGACVVGTGSQNTGKMPVGCEYCQADFSSEASICKFADMIKQRRPDILINNAGINKAGKFEEIALADFKRIQQINLFAPFVLCQAAVIGMREKNGVVSSIFLQFMEKLAELIGRLIQPVNLGWMA